MDPRFETYLNQHIPDLTEADLRQIGQSYVLQKVGKKSRLLEQGNVCRHKIFVLDGLLRTYTLGEDGQEYLMKFTSENFWTTDPESFFAQTPSHFNIEALEPSTVLLWVRPQFEALKAAIPGLKQLSETLVEQSSIEAQKRILLNISATPEERYRQFERAHAHVLHRLPLHMIASYLGLSRKTLSRVRRQRTVVGV